MPVMEALRRELRSLLEHFLLPILAVPLPWPLAYRLLRRVARHPALFEDEWRPALAEAQRYLPVDDPDDWAWRFRTCRLVDHADYWLSRLRTNRWLDRHVQRQGDWPSVQGPALVVFFHWCTGLWMVRALRRHGGGVSPLARPFNRASMGGARLAVLYARLRFHEFARIAGGPLIYPPGTVARSVAALEHGRWLMAAPDVPPQDARGAQPVRLFGREGMFADSVQLIAARAGVPLLVVNMGLDFASGRRELRISSPIDPRAGDAMQRIADHWCRAIEDKPWGFTLWPMMPAFVAPPASSLEAAG